MIKIHDIKPIVEIPDFSVYLYYSLIFLGFLIICLLIYILYKVFKPKVKTQEMYWYEELQNLEEYIEFKGQIKSKEINALTSDSSAENSIDNTWSINIK